MFVGVPAGVGVRGARSVSEKADWAKSVRSMPGRGEAVSCGFGVSVAVGEIVSVSVGVFVADALNVGAGLSVAVGSNVADGGVVALGVGELCIAASTSGGPPLNAAVEAQADSNPAPIVKPSALYHFIPTQLWF